MDVADVNHELDRAVFKGISRRGDLMVELVLEQNGRPMLLQVWLEPEPPASAMADACGSLHLDVRERR